MKNEIKELRNPISQRLPEGVFFVIAEALGKMAMCWTDVEHAGSFQVGRASGIAFELSHYIADLLDEAKEEAGDDSVGYMTEDGVSIKMPMMLLEIVEKLKVANK